MVDLKFTDLPGTWQHMGMALASLDEDALVDGIGFDGSSIRGFQEIYESDMLLLPDPSTAVVDPFYEASTISLVCTVLDPITREPYTRDPRFVATKAEEYLRAGGVAAAQFGHLVEDGLHPARQLLLRARGADVHVHHTRILTDEVVVQPGHGEPVLQHDPLNRPDLVFTHDDVPHGHRAFASRREGDP
ncbi:MAG: glutamine synthetase [Acidobacteria bacterium]|nr:glutamine synthetase [Acidobacteriota bacterium]